MRRFVPTQPSPRFSAMAGLTLLASAGLACSHARGKGEPARVDDQAERVMAAIDRAFPGRVPPPSSRALRIADPPKAGRVSIADPPKAGRVSIAADLPETADGTMHLSAPSASGLDPFSIDVRLLDAKKARRTTARGTSVYDGIDAASSVTLVRRVDGDGVEDFFRLTKSEPRFVARYVASGGALRRIDSVLELLDAAGTPRLRTRAPIAWDANGVAREGELAVHGCAYDEDTRGPWRRPIVSPGAAECVIELSLDLRGLSFPVLVDPAWTATTTTAYAHAHATLVRLPAGSDAGKALLVAGTGEGAKHTELYDPITRTWAASAMLGEAFGEGSNAVALSDGTVVAGGGFPWPLATGLVEARGGVMRRSPTGSWSYAAAMSKRAWFAMAKATIDGKEVALVAGGTTTTADDKPLTETAYYDPAADAWTLASPLATARSHFGAVTTSDGRLLAVGGAGVTSKIGVQLATAEIFDPKTKAWSTTAALAKRRADATLIALPGGHALVAGGWNVDDGTLSSVEAFDGTSWSTLATTMQQRRAFAAGGLLGDGHVVIAGGDVNANSPAWGFTPGATADLIDPAASSVHAALSMDVSRAYAAALAFGGGLLIAGGRTTATGGETNSAQFYDAAIGATCAASSECASGLSCVDGVCCSSPACATGWTCAAPGFQGVCSAPKGTACTTGEDCGTGFCVTGVCCDTACTGTCETCSAKGSEGTCTLATAGSDPKHACGGDPTCGAKCDGYGECTFFPPEGTLCGASTTDAGTGSFCVVDRCNGSGACAHTTNDCGLTCTTSNACDEPTHTCTVTASQIKAGYCVIDGLCLGYGQTSESDPCSICDPVVSRTSWTKTACDAGADADADADADANADANADADADADADANADADADANAHANADADANADANADADALPTASACSHSPLPHSPFSLSTLLLLALAARRRR